MLTWCAPTRPPACPQVRDKRSGAVYAMKVMRKERIMEKDHGEYVRGERDVLTAVFHPYIVALRFSFQTPTKLYLVLDFINGGHLFFNLYKQGTFNEATARLYTAEIVLALSYLHSRDIVSARSVLVHLLRAVFATYLYCNVHGVGMTARVECQSAHTACKKRHPSFTTPPAARCNTLPPSRSAEPRAIIKRSPACLSAGSPRPEAGERAAGLRRPHPADGLWVGQVGDAERAHQQLHRHHGVHGAGDH